MVTVTIVTLRGKVARESAITPRGYYCRNACGIHDDDVARIFQTKRKKNEHANNLAALVVPVSVLAWQTFRESE